jgi:hypothetical protein
MEEAAKEKERTKELEEIKQQLANVQKAQGTTTLEQSVYDAMVHNPMVKQPQKQEAAASSSSGSTSLTTSLWQMLRSAAGAQKGLQEDKKEKKDNKEKDKHAKKKRSSSSHSSSSASSSTAKKKKKAKKASKKKTKKEQKDTDSKKHSGKRSRNSTKLPTKKTSSESSASSDHKRVRKGTKGDTPIKPLKIPPSKKADDEATSAADKAASQKQFDSNALALRATRDKEETITLPTYGDEGSILEFIEGMSTKGSLQVWTDLCKENAVSVGKNKADRIRNLLMNDVEIE